MARQEADPITLEIIQSALQAVSDEMFAAMRKTAMSAIIYEVLDMGTGLTNAEGDLASSGSGIPAFVGVLDKAVKVVRRRHTAPGAIEPGDIFVTNDPHYGGVTHLNDAVITMPVFVDGEIVSWTANIAHWNDVGGAVPGSMSTLATDIFQEGLRLPAVKLFSRGQPIQPVMEIMRANTRLHEYLQGDMWAAVAAVRLGERRIGELVNKYGKPAYLEAIRRHMDHGEQVTLRALRNLPQGRFTLSEEQDDGRVFKVAVEITQDAFTVDLRDSPDQESGPSNICLDGTTVVAQMILKALTDAASVCNGGSFRPLRLLTRPGSLFNANPPAALGFYFETEIRLYDLIWRCLAPHMPDQLPAGHFASICGTVIGGVHPDTGRHFTVVEPELGGWGASDRHDGSTALFSAFHGETFNCPVEITEARNGLFVHPDTGRHFTVVEPELGGRGVKIDYRIRTYGNFLTCGYTRSRMAPWGLAGGQPGTTNYVEVRRASGEIERHAFATGVRLNTGDVVGVVTGNGGGFGDPGTRSRDALREDLLEGYVTLQEAKQLYGLV